MTDKPLSIFERAKMAWTAAVQTWVRGGDTPVTQPVAWHYDSLAAFVTDEDRQRLDAAEIGWNLYRGQHPPSVSSRPNKPDDNVIVNFTRVVVNRSVAFLFGDGLEWDVEDERVDAVLDEVWGRGETRMAFLMDVALTGAVTGDAFILIEWQQGQTPRLVNLDPMRTFPEFAPDSDDVTHWRLLLDEDDEGRSRMRHLWRDDIGRWRYRDEVFERGEWVPVDGTDGIWPWPWSPIIHIKNFPNPQGHYGVSDIEDADLNLAVNKITSYTMRTGRLFPHPLLYGYGVGDTELDTSAFYELSTPEGFIKAVEVGGAMRESSDFAHRLQNWYFMVSQVPSMNPEVMRLGVQSGFALRVLYGPLMEKTKIKRALYGAGIKELSARIADMHGLTLDNMTLHWPNPLPFSVQEENLRDQFALDYGLVSRQTIARARGYDWEMEQARIAEETAAEANLAAIMREEARRKFDSGEMVESESTTVREAE